jgi:hypothetical protein
VGAWRPLDGHTRAPHKLTLRAWPYSVISLSLSLSCLGGGWGCNDMLQAQVAVDPPDLLRHLSHQLKCFK